MSAFSALGNIQCNTLNHSATFTFSDIKMHMVEDLIEVDKVLCSWEKYNQALDQLEAVTSSLEEMGGEFDMGLMSIVNRNNQLGRLLGVYIPPAYRFDMEDPAATDENKSKEQSTGDAAKTTDDKEAGNSVVEKGKELAKKLWEMLKQFFAKIAQGLKSFWQWLRNGFMSNKASNEKLKGIITSLDEQKVTEILGKAMGFLKPSDYDAVNKLALALGESKFLNQLDSSDCSKVMLNLQPLFGKDITTVTGIPENILTDAFVKITTSGEAGLLPTIAIDKEKIAELKKNKAALSTLQWNKAFILSLIDDLNTYYDTVGTKIEMPDFIEASAKYDWENSAYVKGADGKPGVDSKIAKKQSQAIFKFITQFYKLFVIAIDMWQPHLNAIKKFANVDAGGQKTAAPTVSTAVPQSPSQEQSTSPTPK